MESCFGHRVLYRRTPAWLRATVLAGLVVLLGGQASIAHGALPERVLEKLDAYAGEAIRKSGVPGGALGLVSDGTLVAFRGYARGSMAVPSPDTLFPLGALTQGLTAAAALQLRDTGQLNIDAPVRTYLPWFTVGGNGSEHILVRHLLNHTSGLPASAHRIVWRDPATIRPSLEAGVRELSGIRLMQAPGATFEYSLMNYAVLGLVLQEAGGIAFGELLRSRIFMPFGMTTATFSSKKYLAAPHAVPYTWRFGEVQRAEFEDEAWLAPAIGLAASMNDMAHYAAMHMAAYGQAPVGPTILAGTSLVESLTRGVAIDVYAGRSFTYGWVRQVLGNAVVNWQTGNVIDASSAMVLIPEKGLAVVFMADAPISNLHEVALGLAAIAVNSQASKLRSNYFQVGGKALLVVSIFGFSLIVLFILRVRSLGGRKRSHARETFPKAFALWLVVFAAIWWLIPLRVIPVLFPIPLPWGFYGWPIDLAAALTLMVVASTLWALYPIIRYTR